MLTTLLKPVGTSSSPYAPPQQITVPSAFSAIWCVLQTTRSTTSLKPATGDDCPTGVPLPHETTVPSVSMAMVVPPFEARLNTLASLFGVVPTTVPSAIRALYPPFARATTPVTPFKPSDGFDPHSTTCPAAGLTRTMMRLLVIVPL